MDPNRSSYNIIFNGTNPSGLSTWTFSYGTNVFYWNNTILHTNTMRKQNLFIISILILLVIIIIFLYISSNNNRIVILHDYRLSYSDTYKISSNSDLRTIDKIINNMNATQTYDSNNDLRIGGYVLIEERVGVNIIIYRVQGNIVTKYVYKENLNNLISTTYFKLDDNYYQLLQDVCDKQSKKKH